MPQALKAGEEKQQTQRGWRQPQTFGDDEWLTASLAAGRSASSGDAAPAPLPNVDQQPRSTTPTEPDSPARYSDPELHEC